MSNKPDVAIDWFRVITDLTRDGSLSQLSAITSIPRSSLGAYRNGVEPSHSIGMCLVRHWSIKTGRDRDEAPTIHKFLTISVRN